jgi:hypothetical protein
MKTSSICEYLCTLAGDGIVIGFNNNQSFPVRYKIEVLQHYLLEPRGGRMPQQKDMAGTVNPVPSLPPGEHRLQLKDGRVLKCWLDDSEGYVTCEPLLEGQI